MPDEDNNYGGSLGPVHTNPFSNENGAIRKRSPGWSDLKTMPFENPVF